jgi:cobaltochelatase CobN
MGRPRGASLAEALIERHRRLEGRPPRTVGMVLWGFETARSGGETIGQLLALIGASVADAPGWLPTFEPVPAAELGRPRVDVHLMICGFFRDMFPTLVRDLDRLMRDIAALDEPAELNPARAALGDEAADVATSLRGARIFGPAPGEYGTGLPARVEAAAWSDGAELGAHFHEAMGHAYGEHHHGAPAGERFGELLARTEVVSQVIDGDDYKIGDLDHYYEFLGGATSAVERASGRRPSSLVGDSARAEPRLAEAGDELQRCTLTRLLNPRWIEGMLAHPRHGGQQIQDRVTNLIGLGGTIGVPSTVFDRVFETYVADEETFDRLAENNPRAAAGVTRRLGEADSRGLWDADEDQRALIKQRFAKVSAESEE